MIVRRNVAQDVIIRNSDLLLRCTHGTHWIEQSSESKSHVPTSRWRSEKYCDKNFQTYEQQLSDVFCTNDDGSHILPISCIASSVNLVCFKDHDSVWKCIFGAEISMDGHCFELWLQWEYKEVQNVRTGSDYWYQKILEIMFQQSTYPVQESPSE